MFTKSIVRCFFIVILSYALFLILGYQFYVKNEQQKIAALLNERLVLYTFLVNGELDKSKVLLATLLRGDMGVFNDGYMENIDLRKYSICKNFDENIKRNLISFFQERDNDVGFLINLDKRCSHVMR